ncbi:UPF0235 protein C15orf40 homolog isoform X2 [Falco biarmicus]|uniref:UPF0235 protein C15orf40 homolog isoform X2 n=1 Tax=Falco cherrug TaxID=345164 RepID=UPI0024785368|nr:UPF0235 protein C15orf40 homolog isoform X2 [Falco cherrug]XP_056203196.1 UPF0235 protein C15orf40 homolog isoform X2 [Falco biarmicus]
MPALGGFRRLLAAPVRRGGTMPRKGKGAGKEPAGPGAAAGPVVAAGDGCVRVAVRAKPGSRCSAVTGMCMTQTWWTVVEYPGSTGNGRKAVMVAQLAGQAALACFLCWGDVICVTLRGAELGSTCIRTGSVARGAQNRALVV